ncbi:MAG TPA: M50 family metallopeptidase, partial [Pyrinomonadaceae bacterium]|nr:M50 family metallopeptidase [Pyrinomonadaceae bacterium]
MINYRIAEDARPQVKLLIVATLISLGLWLASWFLPALGYIVYPLQLFATFIHEGSHVLASLLTDSPVQSLTVSYDASGEV